MTKTQKRPRHLLTLSDVANQHLAISLFGKVVEGVERIPLDHKHITTTQIYDKRQRSVRDSASHKVPI